MKVYRVHICGAGKCFHALRGTGQPITSESKCNRKANDWSRDERHICIPIDFHCSLTAYQDSERSHNVFRGLVVYGLI
jgi:hypothetical protein